MPSEDLKSNTTNQDTKIFVANFLKGYIKKHNPFRRKKHSEYRSFIYQKLVMAIFGLLLLVLLVQSRDYYWRIFTKNKPIISYLMLIDKYNCLITLIQQLLIYDCRVIT